MAIRKKIQQPTLKKIKPISSSKKSTPKTVADLKKKYRQLPLHFLFGIHKEIDYQCPRLDEYLERLEEIKTALEKIRRCKSLESTQIHAATALHALYELPNNIDQETRNNFENLRKTADNWKQLAISAMNKTKDPEQFLKI